MELLFQTELVQKSIEEEADKEADTVIENYIAIEILKA